MSKPPEVIVTDHCVLRYFERVLGYDIDLIRAGIAKEVAPAIKMNASSLTSGGYVYHLKGSTVATVVFQRQARWRT